MVAYEIPLAPTPQVLTITLASVQYRVSVLWNQAAQYWVLSLFRVDDTPVLLGLPMLPGVDLLEQHKHLQFGGQLRVQVVGDSKKVPSFDELGTKALLFFISET